MSLWKFEVSVNLRMWRQYEYVVRSYEVRCLCLEVLVVSGGNVGGRRAGSNGVTGSSMFELPGSTLHLHAHAAIRSLVKELRVEELEKTAVSKKIR